MTSDVMWNIGPGSIEVEHYDDGTCELSFTGTVRLMGLSPAEAEALVALSGGEPAEADELDLPYAAATG